MNAPSASSRPPLPVEVPPAAVGGKRKALPLRHLMEKPRRFTELSRLVRQITAKMLTRRLRKRERDGLVSRAVHPVTPPKVEYFLTEPGGSLGPLLRAMRDRGEMWMNRRAADGPANAASEMRP